MTFSKLTEQYYDWLYKIVCGEWEPRNLTFQYSCFIVNNKRNKMIIRVRAFLLKSFRAVSTIPLAHFHQGGRSIFFQFESTRCFLYNQNNIDFALLHFRTVNISEEKVIQYKFIFA